MSKWWRSHHARPVGAKKKNKANVKKEEEQIIREREQEIKNFNTKNLSLLTKELQDYNFAIEDDRDADTSLIWNNFTTFYKKTLKKYKDTVYKGKEEEWERFVSHFHSAFNAGKSDLRLIRNNKIKGNAQVSFNLSLDKFKTDVNKQKKFK